MTRYREAKNRIDDILHQFEGTDFWQWIDRDPIGYGDDEYVDCGVNSLYDFLYYNCPDNLCWASGATRIVIWDTDHPDYVMKVAIYEADEFYNEAEEERYNEAVFDDVEEAFAWCSCIYSKGELYSRGIYAMEYLDCDEETLNDYAYSYGFERYCSEMGYDSESDDARDKYGDYCWDCCSENEEVMDYACSEWGWDLAEAVRSFIWKHKINDIHSGNFGYRGSQIVISDYAGY